MSPELTHHSAHLTSILFALRWKFTWLPYYLFTLRWKSRNASLTPHLHVPNLIGPMCMGYNIYDIISARNETNLYNYILNCSDRINSYFSDSMLDGAFGLCWTRLCFAILVWVVRSIACNLTLFDKRDLARLSSTYKCSSWPVSNMITRTSKSCQKQELVLKG